MKTTHYTLYIPSTLGDTPAVWREAHRDADNPVVALPCTVQMYVAGEDPSSVRFLLQVRLFDNVWLQDECRVRRVEPKTAPEIVKRTALKLLAEAVEMLRDALEKE